MDAQYPKDGELIEGWRSTLLLKRDVFSTVERGRFRAPGGEVDAVMRRIDAVPWWARPIAGAFLRREARALMIAGRLGVGPLLLARGRTFLIRGFDPLENALEYGRDLLPLVRDATARRASPFASGAVAAQ